MLSFAPMNKRSRLIHKRTSLVYKRYSVVRSETATFLRGSYNLRLKRLSHLEAIPI